MWLSWFAALVSLPDSLPPQNSGGSPGPYPALPTSSTVPAVVTAGPYCGSVDLSTGDTVHPPASWSQFPHLGSMPAALSAMRRSAASRRPSPGPSACRASLDPGCPCCSCGCPWASLLCQIPSLGTQSSSSLLFSHSCCLLTSRGSTLKSKPPGTWHTLNLP